MTKQQYLKAISLEHTYGDTHPLRWGKDVEDDYYNSDIPAYIGSSKEERINIANYYYFWFPLVKDSLK